MLILYSYLIPMPTTVLSFFTAFFVQIATNYLLLFFLSYLHAFTPIQKLRFAPCHR